MSNVSHSNDHGQVVSMFCVPPPAGCGKEIPKPSDFRDKLSLREYMISGLCQECQDKTFNVGDGD